MQIIHFAPEQAMGNGQLANQFRSRE